MPLKKRLIQSDDDIDHHQENMPEPNNSSDRPPAKRQRLQTTLFGFKPPPSSSPLNSTKEDKNQTKLFPPKFESDAPRAQDDSPPAAPPDAPPSATDSWIKSEKLESGLKSVKSEKTNDATPSNKATAAEDESSVITGKEAIELEKDLIKPIKGSGSPNLDDENFNPALVTKDHWAFYTQKSRERVYNSEMMLFQPLTDIWQRIEDVKHSGTGSKKKAILLLTNFYRLVLHHCPHELIYAIFLSIHKLAPEYFGIEIGIGEALLIKTISETYGRKESSVRTDLQNTGDLGSIAQASKLSTKTLIQPARLTLRGTFNDLRAIAEAKGNNAQVRKRDRIKKLLVAAVGVEPKYIVRFLEKNLRIGVKSAAVLSALATAFILTPVNKEGAQTPPPSIKSSLLASEVSNDYLNFFKDVKTIPDARHHSKKTLATMAEELLEMEVAVRVAFSQVPNLAYVVYHLLCGATATSLREDCTICPGIPVSPMLAKPTKGLSDVLDAMSGQKFLAEFKYDGERIQIHKLEDGTIHLFSRNMEVLDIKYPDVKEVAVEAINPDCSDFIIDAEVVAFNRETKEILPFQTLSGRKRKDVDAKTVDIQVCLFVFDCLRCNGECLVSTSLAHRRDQLKVAVHEVPERLHFARGGTVKDTTELEALLQEAIENRTEGLMVKVLEGEKSYYEPSKRSVNWLKLKKDYLDDLGDSVDLVPIGAFWGRGRRSGTYGTYLLAVYDHDDEVYRTVCKVATGFTDDDLSTHFNFFQDHKLECRREDYHVSEKMYPEVWLDAVQVWECKAADLSISPVHTSGWCLRSPEKGIGLRFPRFLRIRDDKKPAQATESSQIVEMYDKQFAQKKERGEAAVEEEEEDDLLI